MFLKYEPILFYTVISNRALLYGGIGVEISSAILSSIYPPGIAYGKDGVLLSATASIVNKSISATIEVGKCLSQYINNVSKNHVEVLNNTAISAMMSVSSVRYALEVYIHIINLFCAY